MPCGSCDRDEPCECPADAAEVVEVMIELFRLVSSYVDGECKRIGLPTELLNQLGVSSGSKIHGITVVRLED